MSQLDGSGTLETASELALAAFLRPYALENLTEVVQKLTGGGYSSVDSLRGMDDKSVRDIYIEGDDAEKLLLATFLYGNDMPQYGEGFTSIGCTSLLRAFALSDAALQQAGVRTIGHRRQLQKFLREDERVIAKLQRREEDKAQRAAEAKRAVLFGGSSSQGRGGLNGRGLGAGRGRAGASSADLAPPLRFLPKVAPTLEPWEKRGDEDPPSVSQPVASSGSIHNWSQPWATVTNAALFGAPPGLRAEAHVPARMVRDLEGDEAPVQLRMNDGSVMDVW